MIEVNSLAVITAQNPGGFKTHFSKNYDLNRKLRLELKENAFPMMEMAGQYAGNNEHSFLVVNISRAKVLELTEKYQQTAAIWAFLRQTGVPEPHLHFQYLEHGKVVGNKVLPVSESHVENADELFHAIRTGSFKLPVLEKEPDPEVEPSTEFTWDLH